MIAVAGGKGGSGKTTTTLGVARALSRRGASVVAVDADWDLPNLAGLASETREGPESTETRTVIEALDGDSPIRPETARPTVLAAPTDSRSADPRRVFGAVDDAVAPETPTLLDCPAGASPDAAAPLSAADRCLLVTPLRRPALRDAAKTAAIARRLDCAPLGVVVVRAASVPAGVSDLLGCPVLGRVPDGGAVPLSDPDVRAAHDDLARRLVETEAANGWRVA